MSLKSSWNEADKVSKLIVKVFGGLVLAAIIYTAITAIF